MKNMTGPLAPGWSDVRRFIEVGQQQFPLQTELSLAPLVKFWTKIGQDGSPAAGRQEDSRREH